jgi:hypothetical protein
VLSTGLTWFNSFYIGKPNDLVSMPVQHLYHGPLPMKATKLKDILKLAKSMFQKVASGIS